MSYREAKLDTARRSALAITHDDDIEALYLAGSLTAGLGSPTSDVDVFAVSRTDTRPVTRQATVGGERLDIEIYSRSWFEDVVDRAAAWTITRSDLRSKGLSPLELDVLLRLRQSEILKDSPEFQRLRARLGGLEERLRQLAVSRWGLLVNGDLSDFRGAVADRDFESAALVGQTMLVYAGKAVAAAAGDLYYGPKWVYRQLRRSLGAEFPWDRYCYLQRGSWAAEEPEAGAADVIVLTQTLNVAAQTMGWHGTNVAAWPHWLRQDGRYQRDGAFNAIHLTDGVLLNNELQAQYVVAEHVALIWGLCNGRAEKEIVDAALALLGPATPVGQQPLTAPRIQRILATLVARGLVHETETPVTDVPG
jgi:hypothetical protein